MFNIRAIVVVISLLITAFLGCSEKPKGAKKEEGKGVLITASKVEARPVERSVSFNGELQAEEEATIKSEVRGEVAAVYKNLGDPVRKGELIARLDQEEYRIASEQAAQALREAQSRYNLSRLNWQRADGLFSKGLISEGERDEVQESFKGSDAVVKERQASLDLAKKRLRETDIVAPFSGVLKERFVNIGDYIEDKGAVASLVAVFPLKLKTSVPEKVSGRMKRGFKVVIGVDAYPDRQFVGHLSRISPSIDPRTRTLIIEAAFPNRDRILKPGFFAKGKVVIKGADKALFVPEEAISSFAGIKKVFVIENGIASERLVKVGERVENMFEITEGLKGGEAVATSALNKLSTGVKVEIKR